MDDLRHGDIVWVKIDDERGRNPKLRPVIVVSEQEEIDDGGSVMVIAITTTFDTPLSENQVRIPSHPNRNPITGLSKPCVAVCTWARMVEQGDITRRQGRVTPRALARIVEFINKSR